MPFKAHHHSSLVMLTICMAKSSSIKSAAQHLPSSLGSVLLAWPTTQATAHVLTTTGIALPLPPPGNVDIHQKNWCSVVCGPPKVTDKRSLRSWVQNKGLDQGITQLSIICDRTLNTGRRSRSSSLEYSIVTCRGLSADKVTHGFCLYILSPCSICQRYLLTERYL